MRANLIDSTDEPWYVKFVKEELSCGHMQINIKNRH